MSNQFTSILNQFLGDDNFIDNLSQQIGGADREQTRTAANGIVTAMSGAITKTAASEQGAGGLLGLLDADKDGSIIDDAMNMISGGGSGQSSLMQNGAGIVSTLLGGKQNGIISMISNMSGLNNQKTGNLLTMLAPVVLSALSKSGQQQSGGGGLNLGSVLSMVQGTQQQAGSNPAMSMIGKFLDKDGDGDFTDDLLGGVGGNLLGGLFGGKK